MVARAVEDRYRITAMLGRGGMGAVFLAEDLRLERLVAIKVLRPELVEESSFVRRFEREAKIAAQLDHTNIIPIYEVERVGDLYYFVMKYVGGKSLDELLEEGLPPYDRALDILRQAARGLGHAHARGVVHRDVKPSNIMVDETGRVVITDFGISKALEATTQYTSVGQMIGTPRYVSPEQAKAQPLDGRSDQYSLAVVGYQMLVGQLPLVADTVHGLMYMHIYEMPTPARDVRPDLPAHVSDALQRALAKDPDQRFPSMEAFAAALEASAAGSMPERQTKSGPVAGPASLPTASREGPGRSSPTLSAWGRGWQRHSILTAAVGLMVALGLVVLWRGAQEKSREADLVAPAPGLDTTPRDTVSVETASQTPPSISPSLPYAVPPDTTASELSPAFGPTDPPKPEPARPRTTKPAASRRPSAKEVRETTTATTAEPVKPAVGYLTINAIPYGTVSIDGVEVGDTPVFRYELSPGVHIVRVTRPGFRTDSVDAAITAGNEVRLSRTLVRDPP